jgi:hypothetical protein
MEYNDSEQDNAGQATVPASLLPSVLCRLGLEGSPTTDVEEQIAALRNEERHPRGQASLEMCVTAMHDSSWEVRAAAVWALGALGEQAPEEVLLKALSDEDASVRAAALRTLYRIRGRVPLESTLRLLHDADWQVREAVNLTLDELGEQPQFYKEMETHLMAQTPDQIEQHEQSSALNGATPLPSIDRRDTSLRKQRSGRTTPRRSRLLNLFNGIAAVLVVGLIIAGALALFAHRSPNAGSPPIASADVPFQPLPEGCFFLPWQDSKQHCPHNPFTPLNISKHIPGYTITLKQAYADANQVLIEYTVTKDANLQPVVEDLGNYSTLKTQSGVTLRGGPSTEYSSLAIMGFDFIPATIMPTTGTRTLSLRLLIHGIGGTSISTNFSPPLTFDFSLPFHPGRVIIAHKTVTIEGKSITLTEAVATPSETRFYLYSKDVQLDQGNDFTLTDNGVNVNPLDGSVGAITNQDGYSTYSPGLSLTTEIIDFRPLYGSHATCVLTVGGPPGSHIGPWVFHFTV